MKILLAGLGMIPVLSAPAVAGPLQPVPQGHGISAKYPGDQGIEKDTDVVFAENFEAGDVRALKSRWNDVSNREGKVLFFDDEVARASSGRRSLRVVATRGENTGGHLFKVLRPGYDRLYARFYVKFAPDHGFTHHFVHLQGAINPPPWPMGDAGKKPDHYWSSGIEPATASRHEYPSTPYPPPGIWHFYTYWIEMRSWQTPEGRGTSFYGNNFEPKSPWVIPRNRWMSVEFMVKMNTSADKTDGEQTFWIDGRLAGRFAPETVTGYWIRDNYRLDETDGRAEPFTGFRWRRDARLDVNKFWLLYYVTEKAFKQSEEYAARHAGFKVNTRTATVWFDDVVIAKKYIGPIKH